EQFRTRGGSESEELYLHELWQLGYGGAAKSESQKLMAQSTLNFKMVEIVMMLMLPLLAVSLAVPPKRSPSGLGVFVGILSVVAYHKVNQYAEQAGAQGRIEPLIAFWVPFALLCALIFWMYHVLAHKPGGQPIGALERFFAKSAKAVRGMMPKRQEA